MLRLAYKKEHRLLPYAERLADRNEVTTVIIVRDFEEPYFELMRLLREASEIEHALAVQYIYAGLSLRDKYRDLQQMRAPVTNYLSNTTTFIGVAVQEMQHPREVNQFLVALRGRPNLMRQDCPWEPDIYPFEFNLEPLSQLSVAKCTCRVR